MIVSVLFNPMPGESPTSNEVQATPGGTIPEISIWLIGILAIGLIFVKRRR